MALISCPECGKYPVSDHAAMCPECGYGIREHFESLSNTVAPAQEINSTNKCPKCGYKSDTKIDEDHPCILCKWSPKFPVPDKPHVENDLKNVLDSDISTELKKQYIFETSFKDLYDVGIDLETFEEPTSGKMMKVRECHNCGYFCRMRNRFHAWNYCQTEEYETYHSGVCPSCHSQLVEGKPIYYDLKKNIRFYKIYKKHIEGNPSYVDLTFSRIKRERADSAKWLSEWKEKTDKIIANKEEAERNKPTCPMCRSKEIEKITTFDRSISVAAFGVASGKIGKQYQCKKCGHMW